MSDNGHDLHAVFPGEDEILHRLKLASDVFRSIAERHHALAKEIHRIETGIEAASDSRLEDLRKERLMVLDQVAGLIADAKVAA